jgi:hypothetical protein
MVGNITGNAATATSTASFTGILAGDASGTQSATAGRQAWFKFLLAISGLNPKSSSMRRAIRATSSLTRPYSRTGMTLFIYPPNSGTVK